MDLSAELHREHLVRLVPQAVEEFRVDRCRFFPDQPGERGAFRAVSLARRAEAAEQVHLKLRRRGEFVGRQFGGSLVEIVGDAHRTNRVRTGRARAHLVELVHGRQHRPLCLHHHVQVGSQRDSGRSGRWLELGSGGGAFCSVSDRAQPFITAAAEITALRMMNFRRSTPVGISGGTCAEGPSGSRSSSFTSSLFGHVNCSIFIHDSAARADQSSPKCALVRTDRLETSRFWPSGLRRVRRLFPLSMKTPHGRRAIDVSRQSVDSECHELP